MHAHRIFSLALAIVAALVCGARAEQQPQPPQPETQSFRFRSAVELINVNATVTDASGRFVSGLKKDDFRIYEDGQPQTVTHFNSERVPVSLGILLDTSGSMDGEKMTAARRALERFIFDLLGRDDEIFLYRFDSDPELVQGWTSDRRLLADALGRLRPAGGTALYDAVADALPMMKTGRHRKKALVVISDGNDTSSNTTVDDLRAMLKESEIMVYAIGIDAPQTGPIRPWSGGANRIQDLAQDAASFLAAAFQRPRPGPRPFPTPGRPPSRPPTFPPSAPGMPPPRYPPPPPPTGPKATPNSRNLSSDRVNVAALRDITDHSGGRTEIVRTAFDLDPATAGIADELSKQYYLGYPASGLKDGRWHSIRVEVRHPNYRVRARAGFMAAQP